MDKTTKSTTIIKRDEPKSKKVYIERKYNSKLAYQMHAIIHAKKIEDNKEKTKK